MLTSPTYEIRYWATVQQPLLSSTSACNVPQLITLNPNNSLWEVEKDLVRAEPAESPTSSCRRNVLSQQQHRMPSADWSHVILLCSIWEHSLGRRNNNHALLQYTGLWTIMGRDYMIFCLSSKWDSIPYIVHYLGLWSKVVHCIRNRVTFGTCPWSSLHCARKDVPRSTNKMFNLNSEWATTRLTHV